MVKCLDKQHESKKILLKILCKKSCHQLPKRGRLKALVWFWIIDETLVLTSMLSVCRLNEVGTCQVMEQVMIMVMMVMTTR